MDQSRKIVRDIALAQNIVFAGGLPACGKSLLTAVLGSLERVEIQKYNYMIEHICSLYFLDKISEDVAIAMIRMQTDIDLYNMMMAREANFRYKDLSSIFKNPRPWRYIRRLFTPGGEEVVERIQKERPIHHVLTHHLMIHSVPIAKALEDRFSLVELVRHPLYVIKQWHLYIEHYTTDPRDFDVWYDYKGSPLPFFAKGWEDLYVRSNPMDRSIYSIERYNHFAKASFEKLSNEQKSRVIVVPFEKFVKDPWPYLGRIEELLGTHKTPSTLRELKKQNVPRKMVADGIGRSIYRACGWEPSEKGATERAELEKRRKYAAQHASAEAMKVLDQICEEYEQKWQAW